MSLMTEKLPMMHKIMEMIKDAVQKTKICPPMIFCFKGEKFFNFHAIFDDGHKYEFYYKVGMLCKKEGCDFIMAINDAAMRQFNEVEDYNYAVKNSETEAPLSYPRSMRTECILLIACDFTSEESNVLVQTYTEEGGKYTWLKLIESPNFDGEIVRNIRAGFKESLIQ